MGLCPRESERIPSAILDGRRHVEPAGAGGSGEPVGPASWQLSRPRPERSGRFFLSGQVAQLVEHVTENHGVGSSILPLAIALDRLGAEG